jgi:molybdate transport system ATP-binding protein
LLPLVSLSNVNVDLSGRRVLHEISWRLDAGKHWAVLGPNGAGKSTFLRLVRGEIWPAPVNGGQRLYGFDGDVTASPIGVKQKIALVSAEQQTRYMRTDWRMLVWQVVFTGLFDGDLVYHHPTPEQLAQVDAELAALGVLDLRERAFHTLSQGQLRKVLIARALVRRPPVLICDEIGVGLDRASRHELFATIERTIAQGTQVLMTSHRRDELLPAISQRIELIDGRIAPAEAVGASPAKTTHATQTDAVAARDTANDAPFVLDIQNTSVAIDEGAVVVLRDITWRFNTGEHWMLIGDNGAGKTTLLKLILGDLWPAEGGRIDRFNQRDFRDVWEIKRRIGYVSHDLQTRYHHDLTARQVVGTGFSASVGWLSALTPEQAQRVDAALERVGMHALADRSLQQMSYGQARKVLVARALVHDPALLILDEVFDGLDAQFSAELAALFEALSAQTSLILVSHHDGDRLPCITHTLEIRDGGLHPTL